MEKTEYNSLPTPFVLNDGKHVETRDEWNRRRIEIIDSLVGIQYGGLPPVPDTTSYELLHKGNLKSIAGATVTTIRIQTDFARPFSFIMQLLQPAGHGPFPVILNGDMCWHYVTDEVIADALGRGYILALFNRVEIAPDIYNSDRDSGLYLSIPNSSFGALSAWAWGYHRCVDVLETLEFVDKDRIGITGHSRGGKAVLLAGATDERIALTNPNNSGSGGAGCYRIQGPESETIEDTNRAIPYWFGPEFGNYVGRETDLPFDQHFLKALVAPRDLLTTESFDDLWSNPLGTWHTHLAARAVYRFLNAGDNIHAVYRDGAHAHTLRDWSVMLDYQDARIHGTKLSPVFNKNPYPEEKAQFTWKIQND